MYAGDQTAAMRGERSTDPLRLLFLLVLMLNPLSVSHASSLVGSPVCGDCHAAQTDAWRASHHARAMQPAAPETINARWSDSFSHAGVTSRFERAGERFLVHTIDANGRPDTFPVRYTFGVEPLQQYLLQGPRGRLQAFSVAWDTRPIKAGGQRWFDLFPDTRDHRDPLHWSGRAQNWNYMCADCHVTDFRKGYTPADDSFASTFSEIGVGCEACHGPASAHVAWARDPTRSAKPLHAGFRTGFPVRERVQTTPGASALLRPRAVNRTETEVCAPCHARRTAIAEGYEPGAPFLDHYAPALIESGLYHADGQQQDEVFIWGSFLQSRMYAAGVTCSDCHDPHSGQLRSEPAALCVSCHEAQRFDSASHGQGLRAANGSGCVDCHMPATTYMGIDARRDHGFNAHRRPAFADGFAAAWRGDPRARTALQRLAADPATPEIIRASALRAFAYVAGPGFPDALRAGLTDPAPLVRYGALMALDSFALGADSDELLPLLADPLRANRIAAARLLAGYPTQQLPAATARTFGAAASEFRRSQALNADRPEARVALALFDAAEGNPDAARATLLETLRIAPDALPAWINLGDLARREGQEHEATTLLRKGLEQNPDSPDLKHALGLALVRIGARSEAEALLAAAARTAPQNARYAYVHAVALHSAGRTSAAFAALDEALVRHPYNRDLLIASALFHRDAGDLKNAQRYARRLLTGRTDDAEVVAIARSLGLDGVSDLNTPGS